MCPICIFVSVETFLSLNMCQYDQSYNSLKCNQKFPRDEIIWNSIAPCPPLNNTPTFKFSPYNVWKWFNGDRFKLIGVKLQEGFSLDLREHSIFRKMAKVSENSGKFIKNKNSLRSVFVAAWPELVQFNCGNFLVCLSLFFTNKQKNKNQFLFVCLFLKDGEANPSISSEILVMIGSGRFRILNGNERIFFNKFRDRILFRICSWIKNLFLFATQINVTVKSNSWFCWVF